MDEEPMIGVNVKIPYSLHQDLRKENIESGKTLQTAIIEAIRLYLKEN